MANSPSIPPNKIWPLEKKQMAKVIGPIFTHGCRLSPSSIITFVLLNMFISSSHFRNAACPHLQMFSGFDKVVQRSNLSESMVAGDFNCEDDELLDGLFADS